MKTSFIKKIVSVEELKQLGSDLSEISKEHDEKFAHVLDLKHDIELMVKSFSHESLLIWNIHIWGHFNGEKWDGIFIGTVRKSERFNKKFMDEYLWFCKNSNSGIKLYITAYKYAKSQGCEYMSMNLMENNPNSYKLKSFYTKLGYQKDTETWIKKI
jgi:hypothetical protein